MSGSGATATTVFLVRHGAHDVIDRTLVGRTAGVGLGAVGRAQAAALARRLAREPVAAVYASPLERARETAQPVAERLGLAVEIAPELQEIDFGAWTGRSFVDLARDGRWEVWNRERASACPPGGETMAAVQDRVASGLERWRASHPDACVVAVSHADVIRALVCRVLGLSLDRYHAFDIAPASVTTLVAWADGAKVSSLNETMFDLVAAAA